MSFATLEHELAHEMMYHSERLGSTSKRIRETEAEAVAFEVCHPVVLETGSATQDYIQKTSERKIIFLGGKDYIPVFCSITSDMQDEKTVFLQFGASARFARMRAEAISNGHEDKLALRMR